MKIIKLSSIFLLTALMLFGFNLPVSAKSHSKSYHKHYHKSRSRSTSYGFNLNIDPWPRQQTVVVQQPAPIEQVTVYNPPVAPVYGYVAPTPYVQERVCYPAYYQQSVVMRQAPVYVHPQASYWSSGWYY